MLGNCRTRIRQWNVNVRIKFISPWFKGRLANGEEVNPSWLLFCPLPNLQCFVAFYFPGSLKQPLFILIKWLIYELEKNEKLTVHENSVHHFITVNQLALGWKQKEEFLIKRELMKSLRNNFWQEATDGAKWWNVGLIASNIWLLKTVALPGHSKDEILSGITGNFFMIQ